MIEGRDRGQLMVVGALLLAITILGIAALVNTAAFDRPEVAQGGSEAAWEGMEFRDEVDDGIGQVVTTVNANNGFVGYETLNDSLSRSVRDWMTLKNRHEALRARGGEVTPERLVDGTRIAHNGTANFTSPDGEANWTVVRGINDTRHFRMNVTMDNLTRNRGFGSGPRGDYHDSRYFRVNLTPESGSTRGVYIYRNDTGSSRQLNVRVDNGSAMADRCTFAPDGNRVTIDLTGELVGNQSCQPLDVIDRLEGQNYTISYGEGDEIAGVYELYVKKNRTEVDDVQDYLTDAPCETYVQNEIYAADTSVEYASPDVRVPQARWSVEPEGPRGLGPGDVGRPFPGEEIAYRSGNFKAINRSGSITDYSGGGSARGLGPHGFNLDDDDPIEIPFVGSGGSGKLKIIDPAGSQDTIANNDARDNYPVLWAGTWNGSGPSAFYPSPQGGGDPEALKLANGTGGASDMIVWEVPSGEIHGVAGKGDVNTSAPGDELVWYDGNGDIHYLLNNESASLTPGTSISFNASGAEPIGTPDDFDRDGQARIPIVTGNGEVALLNAETNAVTTLTGTNVAKERSLSSIDWDSDCKDEIAFVNQSDELALIDDVGGANTISGITDSGGTQITVDPAVGVR